MRRTPAARIGRRLAASLLAATALAAALLITSRPTRLAAVVVPYPHELAQVSFAVAGDVIPHDPVRAAAAAAGDGDPTHASGWTALFSDVADIFLRADFAFVNLETPVAPAHSRGSKPFLFDAPVALLEALKSSGVKIVSSANNHVMDQGWAGFAETRDHLREQGILFAGSGDTAALAWQPVFTEANGIRVGWLGMTRWLNGNRNPDNPAEPHVNFFPYPGESAAAPPSDKASLDENGVLAAIRQARRQCDLLVVSIHWGVEYAPAPRPEDVETAHKMLEAGASVIVGHHPHVLQPIETYLTADGRSTVVFYSLGNFLSNQSRTYIDGLMPDKNGDPRDSLIGLFSAVRRDYGPGGIRVELGHVGILPLWGENNRNQLARGLSKTVIIRPLVIDREIPQIQSRLDDLNQLAAVPSPTGLPTPLTPEQQQQYIALATRLKLLSDRRALILARTGDEYLTEPPKSPPKP